MAATRAARSLALIFALGALALGACKEDRGEGAAPAGEASTEGKLPKGTLSFEPGPTIDIEVASSPEETRIGLSYRESLCERCGLYFVFPEERVQSFWMRKMRFPIDIVWIQDGVVVGVSENLPPPDPKTPEQGLPSWRSPGPVRQVLEVPAGFARAHGVHGGVKVSVTLK